MDNQDGITVTLKQIGREPRAVTLPKGATPKDLFARMEASENIRVNSLFYAGDVITPSSSGQLYNGQEVTIAPNLKNG